MSECYPLINIDIVNTCNLHCVTCPRGRREEINTVDKMSLDLFGMIIKKASTYNDRSVNLYNWSEPFLCDDLHAYIDIADKYGLEAYVSTNLSLRGIKEKLKKVLYTGKGYMVASVSGFSQKMHQINHRGGDISIVKDNLRFISDCYRRKAFEWGVAVKFLDFGYNSHEIAPFKTWSETLPGIGFSMIPGEGEPLKAIPENHQDDAAFHSGAAAAARYLGDFSGSFLRLNKICDLFFDMNIDCKGDVFLCCIVPNNTLFKLGSFLDDSIDKILIRRFLHPFCQVCPGQNVFKGFPKNRDIPVSLRQKLALMFSDYEEGLIL